MINFAPPYNTLIARAILHQLSCGLTILEIVEFFQINNYSVKSKGSVEKYLANLKKINGCLTTFQLLYEYGKNPKGIIIK